MYYEVHICYYTIFQFICKFHLGLENARQLVNINEP